MRLGSLSFQLQAKSRPLRGRGKSFTYLSTVVRFSQRLRRRAKTDVMTAAYGKPSPEGVFISDAVDNRNPSHLIVMVNGLNGAPGNWTVMQKQLIEAMGVRANRLLLYSSHANQRLETFGGIERCADRLCIELDSLIQLYPSFTEISFLVHSMGGLISRYACGRRFDPDAKTIFGLRPRHFFSIASPHLGCYIEGVSQVPFIGWGYALPLIGSLVVRPFIKILTPFVVTHIYRRTGLELFLIDAERDGKEINSAFMCRIVQDIPDEGYFFSALKSFESRTCCANIQQDALVAWANASIRREEELPILSATKPLCGCALHRTDDLENALWSDTGQSMTVADVSSMPSNRLEAVEFMLRRLQSLPWCRMDICFRGTTFPFLAHAHIQVTRRLINSVGVPVTKYITETLAHMDTVVSEHPVKR